MKPVTFKSIEHHQLILRQVYKLYDHRNKTTPREIRRKEMEYKLLKAILVKMQGSPSNPTKEPSLEVTFTRQELRAVQSLCMQGRKVLNELIIPGYEERMKKESDEKLKTTFESYRDKAVNTDVMYAEILSEVESHL